MRTVVSVSMDPEMATRLKDSAKGTGQSFSARVCDLIEVGEQLEHVADEAVVVDGLFTSTESDDGGRFLTPDGEKSGTDRDQSDTGSEPESSLSSVRPDVIESGNDDQLDSRRDLSGTVQERVYACITTERISVHKIAEHVGVSEVQAGEIVEGLIDEGEPIIMRRVDGEWFCWMNS